MEIYPVVVIGAGPAGLAAAMQLSRQGQVPLVLERERPGGMLWNANLVENYPGFPEGIPGPELVKLFLGQAERLGVEISIEEVRKTSYRDDLFRIVTGKNEIQARYLVAATGTSPRRLSALEIESEAADRIFSEIYPLLDCQEKEILIIGAGDAAFDYALNLVEKNHVTILNRGSEIKALPLLVERAQGNSHIRYLSNVAVRGISLDDQGSLKVNAKENNNWKELRGDYLIAAIGREPDVRFADPSIIKGIRKLQRKRRLFMIGDLVNDSRRQTAIAVGDGIQAAMEIGSLLSKDTI